MSARNRTAIPFNDPTDRASSYGDTLSPAQLTQADRDRARLKAAEMATGRADLTDLLGALGLGDPAEIAAHLTRRRTP